MSPEFVVLIHCSKSASLTFTHFCVGRGGPLIVLIYLRVARFNRKQKLVLGWWLLLFPSAARGVLIAAGSCVEEGCSKPATTSFAFGGSSIVIFMYPLLQPVTSFAFFSAWCFALGQENSMTMSSLKGSGFVLASLPFVISLSTRRFHGVYFFFPCVFHSHSSFPFACPICAFTVTCAMKLKKAAVGPFVT